MVGSWKKVSSERICELKVASVRRDVRRAPHTGEEHLFFVIECRDWVNVIPFIDDRKILLIRQFRHGTDEVTLEIPGGMLDSTGEDPERAASRELVEETGFSAREMERLGFVHPNPALQDNRCHTYLARGCRKIGNQNLDTAEEIEIVIRDIGEIPGLIAGGEITHSLVIAAFFHYFLEVRGIRSFGRE